MRASNIRQNISLTEDFGIYFNVQTTLTTHFALAPTKVQNLTPSFPPQPKAEVGRNDTDTTGTRARINHKKTQLHVRCTSEIMPHGHKFLKTICPTKPGHRDAETPQTKSGSQHGRPNACVLFSAEFIGD